MPSKIVHYTVVQSSSLTDFTDEVNRLLQVPGYELYGPLCFAEDDGCSYAQVLVKREVPS